MSELQIFDVEQNSPEWDAARVGVITASCFKDVLAKGEGITRRKYMLTVLGQRISGRVFEDRYSNAAMERGHRLEEEARQEYRIETGIEVDRVGFMRRGDVGCSPDGVIGTDGLQEIKTKLHHLHLECILKDRVPPEHRAQTQGQLWVSGREWIDFVSYSPGLPLFVKRIQRDEEYIATLAAEVAQFLEELAALQQQISKYKVAA